MRLRLFFALYIEEPIADRLHQIGNCPMGKDQLVNLLQGEKKHDSIFIQMKSEVLHSETWIQNLKEATEI